MKKLLLLLFSIFLLSSTSVFAAFGDTYNCRTIKIAVLTENEATTNVEPMTFSFSMENINLDAPYIGSMTFDYNAIGTLVDNKFGRTLFMDTFDGKERTMASLGTTMAWFDEGDLSISSMYKDDDSKVVQFVSSMSKCNKL
jgi:hypothetical protein